MNRMQDQVAFVGVGETEYGRGLNRSVLSLALDAAKAAIADAGLRKEDIDGICGSGGLPSEAIQDALGIPEVTWGGNTAFHFIPSQSVASPAHAVHSDACETALVVWATNHAQFARRMTAPVNVAKLFSQSAEAYTAWAGRYLHDYDVPAEALGLIAINSRTNAALNRNAAMRTPLTMDDYLNSRWIREPLRLLDMEIPVDSGNALVLTTAERARDLPKKPVYIHSTTQGMKRGGTEHYELAADYRDLATWSVSRALWGKSDLQLSDVDVVMPYDGFTIISLAWYEALGYCGPGEGWDFLSANWDEQERRLKIDGRVVAHPMGGSLSKGGSQGASYFHEAVLQLRGEADNQVPDCKTALLAVGGFFQNASGTLLRASWVAATDGVTSAGCPSTRRRLNGCRAVQSGLTRSGDPARNSGPAPLN